MVDGVRRTSNATLTGITLAVGTGAALAQIPATKVISASKSSFTPEVKEYIVKRNTTRAFEVLQKHANEALKAAKKTKSAKGIKEALKAGDKAVLQKKAQKLAQQAYNSLKKNFPKGIRTNAALIGAGIGAIGYIAVRSIASLFTKKVDAE